MVESETLLAPSVLDLQPLRRALAMQLIQAPGAIALEIKRHIGIAYRSQALNHLTIDLFFDQTWEIRAAHLNARNRIVVAHAHLPEAQGMQEALGAPHFLQRLYRHWRPIRDTRRVTGQGGLIPHRHTQIARNRSNLFFLKADLLQRPAHAKLARRALPRPKIAQIILIDAIGNRLYP